MEIIFATANKHKLEEARQILGEDFILKTPADYGLTEEIPETCDTIEGNARQKAEYILKKLGKPCFADDTGLFVDILNGAPGVYSARYAGPGKSASDNIARLLEELRPFSRNERKAHFSTVIAFATPAETLIFEGRAEGRIATVPSGEEGFGYDPVFMTSEFGEEKSFSELTPQEKNSISHRGEAMRKFAGYLKKPISQRDDSPPHYQILGLLTDNTSVSERGGKRERYAQKVGKGGNIALLHPLSIIEGEVSESRRGSLKYIKEITAPYGLHTIRYDFNKSAIAIFISELLYRTLITGQSDPILYDFIENAIIALERSSSTANFPIWFLYHYTALLGFPPKRGFESEYNPFTPLQRDILDNIQQYPSHEAMDFPLKGKTRTEFAENFIRYIGYHLGIRIQMKSLPVLHSLFSATIETSSNDTD